VIPQDDPTAAQQPVAVLRAALDIWVAHTGADMSPHDQQDPIRGLPACQWGDLLAEPIRHHVRSGSTLIDLNPHRQLLRLMSGGARAALAFLQASGLLGGTQLAWPEDLSPAGAPAVQLDVSSDDDADDTPN